MIMVLVVLLLVAAVCAVAHVIYVCRSSLFWYVCSYMCESVCACVCACKCKCKAGERFRFLKKCSDACLDAAKNIAT